MSCSFYLNNLNIEQLRKNEIMAKMILYYDLVMEKSTYFYSTPIKSK